MNLVIYALFRALFYFVFVGGADHPATAEVLKALSLGLRFDVRLALIVTLPFLILSLFQVSRKIWSVFYAVVFAALLPVFMVDIGYYAYLQSRINFRVFEFFENPLISFQMVYETYNLWLLIPLYFLLLAGIYFFLKRVIFTTNLETPPSPKPRSHKIIQSTVIGLLILVGLYGRLGQYPLRWSDAFFSQNIFVASLAMNPVQYIFDTAKNSKRDYDVQKVRAAYPAMAAYLGVTTPNPEKLSFLRAIPQAPRFSSRPNVVYIVMESMAAYKTGAFGNRPEASPALDALAREGWLFRHFYTPTEGTARSMFCVLTGVPDINAKSTSSRNPLIINQNTLINGLAGYEKSYFIGGSATWGNIRGVYVNNIDGLKMYEDVDLGGSRTDVWGLSDLDLFRAAHRVLSERYSRPSESQQPFFALIQSASFHRPYTIPPEATDFERQTLTPAELEKYGFASNEEYNSFRFADYSLGEFFRLIKKEPFFKNTIFIIHGDHGLPHYGAAHLSAGYKHFGLNRFHTPLVFYSPLIAKPQEFNVMMSEADVWPTLLGALGLDFANQALGRNVLALKPDQKDYAFSYVYYTDPLQILLYDREYLAYGTENGIESLHRYNDVDPKKDLKGESPEKFKEMSEILQGIFETSKYILHHNQRPQTKAQKPE